MYILIIHCRTQEKTTRKLAVLAFPGSGPQAGLNLALEGKVSAEPTDELHFLERSEVLWFFSRRQPWLSGFPLLSKVLIFFPCF